jgi:hypothetical protein
MGSLRGYRFSSGRLASEEPRLAPCALVLGHREWADHPGRRGRRRDPGPLPRPAGRAVALLPPRSLSGGRVFGHYGMIISFRRRIFAVVASHRRVDVNSIGNRTLISARTNRLIRDRAPAEYLDDVAIFPAGPVQAVTAGSQSLTPGTRFDRLLAVLEGGFSPALSRRVGAPPRTGAQVPWTR